MSIGIQHSLTLSDRLARSKCLGLLFQGFGLPGEMRSGESSRYQIVAIGFNFTDPAGSPKRFLVLTSDLYQVP
ncbi:hypothetical protein NG796_22130 [Laspinema sp. A4]|uniref:hypothetical protein n=1 Tax=Laspinema sp. D2d TaxID=2953686 RepID=UPI0021BAE499|nr:hypothetical protein [Laspinema sp. D2d]MCT7985981.1 hypothetical protein [Laspinema sp. D2d]